LSEARTQRDQRETLLYAIARVAVNDPEAAATQYEKITPFLSGADRAYGWSLIALPAARKHMPQALNWFAQADGASLSEEQLAWWVRAALRVGDWATVRRV